MNFRYSEHTENGVRLANFIFYGSIVLPLLNIAIFFDKNNSDISAQTINIFVLLITFVLAGITIYNTLRFYNFYRTHNNSDTLYSNFDIVMCYILPFIDVFRLPKLFTEVMDNGYKGILNSESKRIKQIIIVVYIFIVAFYLAVFYKLDNLKLLVVALSTAFGFYSGFYFAIQIRKIYMLQNSKALELERIKK